MGSSFEVNVGFAVNQSKESERSGGGERTNRMTDIRIGPWIIDLERRTATLAGVTVTIVAESDETFRLSFSGPLSAEGRAAIEKEVLAVMQRAHVLAERQHDWDSAT